MQLFDVSKYSEFNIQGCGKKEFRKDDASVLEPQRSHMFAYVMNGKGFYTAGREKVEVRKGTLIYLRRGTKGTFQVNNDETMFIIYVEFDGSMSLDLLDLCNLNLQNSVVYDRGLVLKVLFDDLFDDYEDTGNVGLRSLGYFYEIAELLIAMCEPVTAKVSNKEKRLVEAISYIKQNYQNEITIKEIAEHVDITPVYLSNLFKNNIGVSPKDYLTNYRMEKACYYLVNSEKKIKEIGKMVGYMNQLHFSAEFKKRMKMSPKDYRERGIN